MVAKAVNPVIAAVTARIKTAIAIVPPAINPVHPIAENGNTGTEKTAAEAAGTTATTAIQNPATKFHRNS